MEFRFDIKEVNTGSVVIDAESYEDAIRDAYSTYHDGEVTWTRTELSVN